MDTFPHKTPISSFNLTALPPNPPNRGAFMHGIVPSMLVTSFLPMLSSQPAVSSFPPIGGIEGGGTIGGNLVTNSTCNAPQPPESGGFHPWHLTEIIEISSQPAVSSLLRQLAETEGAKEKPMCSMCLLWFMFIFCLTIYIPSKFHFPCMYCEVYSLILHLHKTNRKKSGDLQ